MNEWELVYLWQLFHTTGSKHYSCNKQTRQECVEGSLIRKMRSADLALQITISGKIAGHNEVISADCDQIFRVVASRIIACRLPEWLWGISLSPNVL